MFTGIVERTGRVVSLTRVDGVGITQLILDPGKDFETRPGDSVAVNGACLTVTSNKVGLLAFDVSSETLAKTSLGLLRESSDVNLERAMRLGDRLGGHLVSGHIDGTGTVVRVNKRVEGWDVGVAVPLALGRYLIAKGSITVDGVSLTVNALKDDSKASVVSLMLIPATVAITTLKGLHEGQIVNVEVDPIAKYVERLTAVGPAAP